MRVRMLNLNLWISTLVWSLLLWKLEVTSAGNTTVIEGVEFGEMNTVVKTESYVYHIEVDINNPDQLIFSDGSALKTWTGKEIKSIVGQAINWGCKDGIGTEAKFRSITGFAQLATNTLLAVDYGNSCLRLVDRLIRRTSHFAGLCSDHGWNGFRDGANALFDHPRSVVQDPSRPNIVLITDQKNNAIREIDFSEYPTRTKTLLFDSSGSNLPSSLAFDTEGNLIISNQHFIRKDSASFHAMKVDHSEIVGSTASGFKDGAFGDALFSSPREVAVLSPNITLVADEDNGNLRVLSESSGSVSSICYRSSTSPGNATAVMCKLNKPQSVMVKSDDEYRGKIYVGEHSSIKFITYALPRSENKSKD